MLKIATGWKMFFSCSWDRFEHHLESLIDSISKNSELIDKEAASHEILQAKEWRQRLQDDALSKERRWEIERREAVLGWLQASDINQEVKLEWLRDRCTEGTSSWITQSSSFTNWLQSGGASVLWLHGKPGSGILLELATACGVSN